ncbi:hypothetical protein CPB83DRAFT_898019 [Crepidotus variabilis]|uniref:Uncharacterized protein n=1 Tax=Crepidotus variabilis TaxID=179855 RepID=A0A9P6E868_9AGAR|nr:hypothetical protein CPB83DRAFT_898019 [Crepidotus variabilis]
MKFSSFFVAALSIVGAAAQASCIGSPAAGSNISPNQQITVQVVRPNSIQGSTEVGLAIGLLMCQQNPCPPPSGQLGSVLYTGQFSPQPMGMGQYYQNFTVTVPSYFQAPNKAQLATARLHLIGAGPSPNLELNTVSLNIV